MYFDNCHTPEQLKAQHNYWAMKLHPDKGGDPAQFRTMRSEYESLKYTISSKQNRHTLPDIFSVNGNYEYYRRVVKYVGTHYKI